MCEALLEPTPRRGRDMYHHCTFMVLNGCIWERKGAFGTGKGAKTAEQKNSEHYVLILGVKMRHAVGEGPNKDQNINLR